jgi:Rho-binding antiterminator
MEKSIYKPISCDFHSELELLALKGTLCKILYKIDNGNITHTNGIIKDLYTSNKEEFLLLQDSTKIRLDRLVSVNGMELKSYC